MNGKPEYRDLAVFTIVQDEPEFIHPWINHYRKHVGQADDIYILNHAAQNPDANSAPSDAVSEWRRAQRLISDHHSAISMPVHHNTSFDHRWLSETVASFQSFLLRSYKWVLFAEIDEFILPNPETAWRRKSLLEFARSLDCQEPVAVHASGFEVVQQEDEPPLPESLYAGGSNRDLTAGDLLEGRASWCPSRLYSKTLLANTPTQWELGFHLVLTAGVPVLGTETSTAPLVLIHLHKVDFDLALRRVSRSRARKWSQWDVDNGAGYQNRLADEASLRVFWKQDPDTNAPWEPGRFATMPRGIRQSLGRNL